jgi:putative addiction module killer protein
MVDIVVRRYRTADGAEPFTEWLQQLDDRKARACILVRIERVALGNFGDAKLLREGVWELRVDFGPGYRVYFAREDPVTVILLCAGVKRKQDADIKRAIDLWQEYKGRKPRPGARH